MLSEEQFEKAWNRVRGDGIVNIKTKGMKFTLQEWVADPFGRDSTGEKNCALFKNKTHKLIYPALRLMNDIGEGRVQVID